MVSRACWVLLLSCLLPLAGRAGDLRVGKGKGCVFVPCRVAKQGIYKQLEGRIEYVLCGADGKTYERLLVTEVQPRRLAEALIGIGLQAGTPAKDTPPARSVSKVTRDKVPGGGLRPSPAPARVVVLPESGVDGFEDGKWTVESWGRNGVCTVERQNKARGAVLHVTGRAGPDRKFAAGRDLAVDLSGPQRFVFEGRHDAEEPIQITWGFRTGEEDTYFESFPIVLPPGPWRYDLALDPAAKTFKRAATQWRFTSPLVDRGSVRKLNFIVEGLPRDKSVWIDRVRLEAQRHFIREIPLTTRSARESRGVAWADYDSDGDLDILVCSQIQITLLRNDYGEYTDVTIAAGLSGGARCGAWADYDGDGDLDLFLSTPTLWTNEGGRFRNAAALLPRLRGYDTEGAGWLDANGDGWPDLLLSNGEYGLYLFLNQGKGPKWFQDASVSWGLGRGGLGTGNGDFLAIADYDGDGFTEFLYNVGRGVLARNEEGRAFATAAGAGISYATGNAYKLGAAFGDYDRDGDLDLVVPQPDKCHLYRNNNDLALHDVTDKAGDLGRLGGRARSACWGDVDCDGLTDLVIGFVDGPARFLRNTGKGGFVDMTAESGLDRFDVTKGATGMAFADWDNDGDADLLITGEGRRTSLLINASQPRHRALRVDLPRSQAPGALVHVRDAADRVVGVWQPGLSQNFSSQEPPRVTCHLPTADYRVSVLYTDGQVAQQSVSLREGDTVWTVPDPGRVPPSAKHR